MHSPDQEPNRNHYRAKVWSAIGLVSGFVIGLISVGISSERNPTLDAPASITGDTTNYSQLEKDITRLVAQNPIQTIILTTAVFGVAGNIASRLRFDNNNHNNDEKG